MKGNGSISRVLPLVIGIGIATACESAPPPASIDWVEAEGYRVRALAYRGEAGARFSTLSPPATGLVATTVVSEERRLENRTLTHGAGVALGDVDGDGWVDVYICLLDRPNVLYRNLGGWRFEDATPGSGTGLGDRVSRGAVLADADGDGDLDLLVAIHGGTNVLLVNDGRGRFEERPSGFAGSFGSTTLALADIDGDSDLDVYFANYKTVQGDDLFSPAERNLRGFVERVGDQLVVAPPFDEHYRLELVDERSLRFELADPDEFYLNDGSGHFEPVDVTSGVFRSSDGTAIGAPPRDWGLVARFFDADDDGDADLYVANDFGSRDGFWLNEEGTFTAATGLQLRTTSGSSMGVDFSDIDGDGDTDFVTTEMLARDPARRREQAPGVLVQRTPPGRASVRAPAGRNTLQLNRGDGTYAEVGRAAGVHASEWTWGAMFFDADLDGFEDLLITNGHAWDPLDGDTQEALRTGRIQVDWQRELGVFPPLPLRNLAFRNRGDGTFEEMGRLWGYGTEPDVSHGIAAADLDRDGDHDLIITRLDEPPLVLRNDAGGARVAVRVLDRSGNTQAVGARATLEGGAVPLQTRQVTAGGMYLSGSDPLLVFAMGASEEATLLVTWPSGAHRSLRVAADHAYEVFPPVAADTARATARGPADQVGRPEPTLLFTGPRLLGRHRESAFDELARQPLIGLELSRGGPGVSWEDIDSDGDPDLLTGSGAGGRALVMRNERGRLLDPVGVGATGSGDHTTILMVPSGSGLTLLAGISAWEARTPAEADSIPALARLSVGRPLGIPSMGSATGPLAAADVDADGDVDLFLGGRAVPGAYPRPAGSRMLRNEGGAWIADAAADVAFREVGLVSAAVFSDVDDDGDADLLLGLEWGPVKLFLNDGGRFVDRTDAWGLGALPGRWNGVATGDLNGDGRPDLVATGWGTNLGYPVSSERPAGIHAADFDGNGLVDIIESETDEAGEERPLRDYLTLSAALPLIRRSAPSFQAFARATVDELLSSARVEVFRAHAVTLRHTVFLNTGARFEARPLPPGVQLAPAFGVVIGDFDRDGAEDVFLAQNFLATPQGVARFDAGRGVVLLGDGQGGFRALDAAESGVAVYGDARGAAIADFDADGRWDLAVGQNGGETAIFRGAGGSPGLRVRLAGPPTNPAAVGARVRVVYDDGEGPAREVQSGSGYWSTNGSVHVFGRAADARAVRVRWPGGAEEEFAVEPGVREIVVRPGGGRQ